MPLSSHVLIMAKARAMAIGFVRLSRLLMWSSARMGWMAVAFMMSPGHSTSWYDFHAVSRHDSLQYCSSWHSRGHVTIAGCKKRVSCSA